MTDDTVLDTTIDEPSMTGGEVEMLLFGLDRSRAGLNRPSLPDLIDAASADSRRSGDLHPADGF